MAADRYDWKASMADRWRAWRAISIAAALLVSTGHAQRVLRVPLQYASIQAAVDAAMPYDTVRVAPGVYRESVRCLKAVNVVSDFGPWVTTIMPPTGPGIEVGGSAAGVATIDGFQVVGADLGGIRAFGDAVVRNNVIRQNRSPGPGGGVVISGWNVTVKGNWIVGNVARFGGGVAWDDENPRVIDNIVMGNLALDAGGGLYGGVGVVESNQIRSNIAGGAGGGFVVSRCCPGLTIRSNLIVNNLAGGNGGGLMFQQSGAILEGNTVAANTAVGAGGGLWVEGGAFNATNTIIWGNRTYQAGTNLFLRAQSTGRLSYSVLESHAGSVVVDASSRLVIGVSVTSTDPGFVDAAGGDFHLEPQSPLVDAGVRPVPAAADFEGNPRRLGASVDIGADEVGSQVYVVGRATPGGTVRLRAVGRPGQSVWWGVSANARLAWAPLPGHGVLRLSGPYAVIPLGTIPARGRLDVVIRIPTTVSVPRDVITQGLVGSDLTREVVIPIR